MKIIRRSIGILLCLLTLGFITTPLVTTCYYLLRDPGLRSAAPSRLAMQLHRSLSKALPDYIDTRITSGKATTLGPAQITATEWPVYGAFFYLLATENLQLSWKNGHYSGQPEPAVVGRQAIDASLRIMLDEGHAHWVKDYWGEDYLNEPNCFYRMLMIGSLSSHHNLTGDPEHLPLLRQITNDLAADLDRSPAGLIDDYPEQCFPADVAVAITMIRHADSALGTDRKAWAKQALSRLLQNFGGELPPYTAIDHTGQALSPTRGCTNGFFFSFAKGIDPDLVDPLYSDYRSSFWQEGALCRGWREFPREVQIPKEDSFYMDPDSGPVITGFGTSATGLGLGGARRHGDQDRAGQLGAELIASALPFPTGHLLIPSLVGDREHAPHFPEIVLLHQLSISNKAPASPASIPPIVWLILLIELIISALFLHFSWSLIRTRKPRPCGRIAHQTQSIKDARNTKER